MNLHEYQAKHFLKEYSIYVPEFGIASSVEEAERVIEELQLSEAVVKIQVHAGGRGKAGGVQFAKGRAEILKKVRQLLGMRLVNAQTGPEGIVARTVLLSKPVEIEREYYLAALIDRTNASPILIASPQGGMDIEEVAKSSPEQIIKIPFSDRGLHSYQLIRLAKLMGWEGELAKRGSSLAKHLCTCFLKTDASLIEINPLVCTVQQELMALDAKMSIDDNALFRHPEMAALFDPTQISPQEARARECDLSYIAMQGTIGCMVNGAGLAMATMDLIQLYGGSPANFLDVGGGATKEKIAMGFRIILSDPKVKAVLINIFGGIMNCATIAEGVIHASEELKVRVPVVVRLEGTNVNEGRRLFAASRLECTVADSFDDAAKKVVRYS